MATYTIYADYHLGHPYALNPDFDFGENTVFLGDNFDLKNTLKKDLPKITASRQETIAKCKKAGGIYLSGNHSLESLNVNDKLFCVRNRILFIHGDTIQWGKNRSMIYRAFSKKGKSRLYWAFLNYWKKRFPGHVSQINKKHVQRSTELAYSYNCSTIVMGHFHPEELIDIKEKDVRIIAVPRGKTVLDI